MKRNASAVWKGSLKEGQGTLSTASGVLSNTQYDFAGRFEEGTGTNPEELVGAAHAGCFSMARSGILGDAGFTPDSISTTAVVTMVPVDGAPTVTQVALDVTAKVPGASEADFMAAADKAKAGCPISRLLKAEITMTAKLIG